MSKAEVTAHLKKFDKPQRDALQVVRVTIAEILPEADEVIKYGIPTFAIKGKGVIGFDGWRNHNSIFPYSGSMGVVLKDELAKYTQTKGSIHFEKEKPFPKTLLKKIIKERLKQMAER
ncbi:MAG: iron chaperone [Candidatus Planktophila sp.]